MIKPCQDRGQRGHHQGDQTAAGNIDPEQIGNLLAGEGFGLYGGGGKPEVAELLGKTHHRRHHGKQAEMLGNHQSREDHGGPDPAEKRH